MPQIRTYDAPSLGLNPTEIGVDATAAAARRIGATFNQRAGGFDELARNTEGLGNFKGQLLREEGRDVASDITTAGDVAVQYEDHQQISHGAATFAQLTDDLTNKWNDFAKNSDPNDASAAAKFRETVLEPALENFSEGFSTENSQKWAESHVAALRQHMFEKTSADMSTLAGIAVQKNIKQAATSMSNTAITDPSAVPFLLGNVDHSIGGMVDSSPNIRGVDAARAKATIGEDTKAQIVKAGAIGAIQKSGNPEATADEWIKKYPTYINGDEAKMLAGNARQQIRARNYDFESNRRRDKEIATDKSAEATNQYIIDVRSKDQRLANDPTAQKILNDPTLLKQDKTNLLNLIDRQLKPETDARLSQQTFVGLLRDMRAPDADPDKIMQKAWDARLTDPGKPGSMSESDFNQFRQEVIARKTPEGAALERDRTMFFKNYAGAIAGPTYDPVTGSPALYAAEMDARKKEAAMRAAGKDPSIIYDPSSPDFFGKPANVQRFKSSMQDQLRANPSGQGEQVLGIKVENKFAPPSNWLFSATRKQFKDPSSGKVYDMDGKEVK
jgi:hypothetical protein